MAVNKLDDNKLQYLAVSQNVADVVQFCPTLKTASCLISWLSPHLALWSPCGSYIAVVPVYEQTQVNIYDARNDFAFHASFTQGSKISRLTFSPKSSYLMIWCYYHETANPLNLTIWNLSTQSMVHETALRSTEKTRWPFYNWSDCETYIGRATSSEVLLYTGGPESLNRPSDFLIKQDRVVDFQFSPESPDGTPIAIVTAANKNKPGSCMIYNSIAKLPPASSKVCPNPDCIRRFFQGQDVELYWSADGKSLLALVSNAVDKSGKSYYGSNALHLLRSNGDFDSQLVSAEEGPIHALCWSPKGCRFIACKGKMPAEIHLYDGAKGKPLLDFGKARRNMIKWNSFGSLVAIGGFGNLSGDFDVWNVQKSTKIASTRASCCVVFEFAPDGRHIMAATTSPRLRVDNNVTIYDYNGILICKTEFTALYHVQWRTNNAFTERPLSPRPANIQPPPAPPPVYRAPGAGRLTDAARQSMNAEESRNKAKKVQSTQSISTIPGLPPGFNPGKTKPKRKVATQQSDEETQRKKSLLKGTKKRLHKLEKLKAKFGDAWSDADKRQEEEAKETIRKLEEELKDLNV